MHNEVKTTTKTVVLELQEANVDIARPVILFRHGRICSIGLCVDDMRAAILIGDKPEVDEGGGYCRGGEEIHVTPFEAQSGF